MAEKLTEEDFRRHLNTHFNVRVSGDETLPLELEEVQSFPALVHARGDMERYSLFFRGPANALLQQQIYRLEHEEMGALDIFLVPVEQDAKGFRYEAFFSYFK